MGEVKRGRRLAALRARAERGSTEGERAAARRALAFEEERVDDEALATAGPRADVEVGEVEPGLWEARDRDGRGTRYQVRVESVEIARDWFLRGAMCIPDGAGAALCGQGLRVFAAQRERRAGAAGLFCSVARSAGGLKGRGYSPIKMSPRYST
jgi:hypothetical protein